MQVSTVCSQMQQNSEAELQVVGFFKEKEQTTSGFILIIQ